MKFWKKLQIIGSVVVIVLGAVALIAAFMQDAPVNRPVHGLPAPQQAGTQGL